MQLDFKRNGLKEVRSFNKIQTKNKFFGLEVFDLLILIALFTILFSFFESFWTNALTVVAAYFVLRGYKKGKPEHWTSSVIRFLMHPKTFYVKRERKEEVFE